MSGLPLELDGAAMRGLAEAALARVVAHLEALPSQPADGTAALPDRARELIERDPPEQGAAPGELLDLLFERAVPHSFNSAGPGYLAYVPGGGLFASAVADLIGDAVNRYTGLYAPSPSLVQLETNVLRWFVRLVGLPEGAGGILTSGGSLANFSALVAARHERLGEDFARGVVYTSDQAHHSVAKAATLAGFPGRAVRVIPSDGRQRMRLGALTTAIGEDRAAGLVPAVVVGSAGTTNTGAVDDLPALAALARREGLWFHVDAAYGGFFVLTARGRAALAGIEQADSVTLDPHKGLFLPYGNGCLLVRDVETLRRSHGSAGDYLPAAQHDPDCVDFAALSPELSRGYRGLSVWLPLKLHGVAAFRAALDEKLDLARYAAERLRAMPEVELLAEPELSLVAFRVRVPGASGEAHDARNRRILEAINTRQRVHLSGAVVAGAFVLRFCIVVFRTHQRDVDAALADLVAAIAETA